MKQALKKMMILSFLLDENSHHRWCGCATGSLDASNKFKPALARGEFKCIGAS